MANYRIMYYRLFNKVTDIINQLQEIQQECEDLFIESDENKIIDITKKTNNDDIFQ